MATSRLTEEFQTEKITVRGTEYTLRELSANEYEDIVKLSSDEEGIADLNKVLRLMAIKAVIDPKLDSDAMGRKPFPVYQKLLATVNEMHFGEASANGAKKPEDGEAPNS